MGKGNKNIGVHVFHGSNFSFSTGIRRFGRPAKSGGRDMRCEAAIGRLLRVGMVLVASWILGVGAAEAAHNDNMGNLCYNSCHVLNEDLAEPNTKSIRAGVRTLGYMTGFGANPVPEVFGCTFCHNDPSRTTFMKNALSVFEGRPSQHPVDRGYQPLDNTRNVLLDTNSYTTMYLANWDNSWTDLPSNQIGCVECHEVTNNTGNKGSGPYGYPNHPDKSTEPARQANPVMLRGGTSSWDNGHASNSFCLTVCHSGTAPGTSGYTTGVEPAANGPPPEEGDGSAALVQGMQRPPSLPGRLSQAPFCEDPLQ